MGNEREGNETMGGSATDPGADWPPHFPHPTIDELVARLETADTLAGEDALELLALIAREVHRLRATVVRLSATKLSEADREARQIVAAAVEQADSLRSLGLAALEARLDEADRLLTGMRAAFRTELGATQAARRARAARTTERGPWGGDDLFEDPE